MVVRMRERNIAILGCALGAALIFFIVWRGNVLRDAPIENVQSVRQEVATVPLPPPAPPRLPLRGTSGQVLTSLRWEQVPSSTIPWETRDAHVLAVFHDALWLMGGLDGNGLVTRGRDSNSVRYWEAPHFDDVWTSKNGTQWELATAHAPWGKRRSAQAVEFKGKLWLMGGWGPQIGYRSDVWASNDGVAWNQVTAKAEWPAREGHSLVVWQGKMWLIGGVRYDIRKTFNDVWSSDDGIHWTAATTDAAWLSRWDHAVGIYKDRMWFTAGMDLKGNTFDDVWVSDDGATWQLVTKNPPWRERQGHVLLDYKGKLWTLGILNDRDAQGPNDVWFTEDGTTWTKTDVDAPWLGREDLGAVVFNGKMWVAGGMDSNWHWNNDVWYSEFGR